MAASQNKKAVAAASLADATDTKEEGREVRRMSDSFRSFKVLPYSNLQMFSFLRMSLRIPMEAKIPWKLPRTSLPLSSVLC